MAKRGASIGRNKMVRHARKTKKRLAAKHEMLLKKGAMKSK